ncbi:hypothetical protein C3381_27050, partial [Citrobacter freundii complex sp. CFNIH6]
LSCCGLHAGSRPGDQDPHATTLDPIMQAPSGWQTAYRLACHPAKQRALGRQDTHRSARSRASKDKHQDGAATQ